MSVQVLGLSSSSSGGLCTSDSESKTSLLMN